MENLKVGIIIPDRGDRPKFLLNCWRMMFNQTHKNIEILIVNHPGKEGICDITPRYRFGYDYFRGKGFDAILLIENDDWYAPDYIEVMLKTWVENGKPDLLGTNYTIYYHLKQRAFFTMEHFDRASAMNTLIKSDLDLSYPADNDPYFDIHVWKTQKGITFRPEKTIAIGMKHGVGLCGGRSHVDRLNRYKNQDLDFIFIKSIMDQESYLFYSTYFTDGQV